MDDERTYLKSHVQHSVSLIEHQEYHFAEGHHPSVHQVVQSPRCRYDHVATSGQLGELSADVRPTIYYDSLHIRVMAELLRFGVYLASEFSCGCEDDGLGHAASLVDLTHELGRRANSSSTFYFLSGRRRWTALLARGFLGCEYRGDHGQEKCKGLAGSLKTREKR